MACDATQRLGADVAFADVPVSIDTRVITGARIVEMNGAHIFGFHRLLYSLKQRFESVFLAYVVAGSERMRRVETNAERQLWANADDRFQVFETMADASALSGSVL